MRILFDLGHPAHVHFFKYIIRNLEADGHSIMICIREREGIVGKLLETYGFQYEELGKNTPGLANKMFTMFKNDRKLLKISKQFNPDLFVSVSSPYAAQVSWLTGKPSIAFTDTDTAKLILSLTVPFTDAIITPDVFTRDLGSKQIRIRSYKELAYLHPNWFKPDIAALEWLNLSKGDKYVLLRFSAFDASHDIATSGLSIENKLKLVDRLEKHAAVFVSSEIPLPGSLDKYSIKIPPHLMHDVLYHASLFIADSGTMVTEAAILGTPAIICHPRSQELGNFNDLERNYGLIYNVHKPDNILLEAIELINQQYIKDEWFWKSRNLLRDKIDLTAFMTWFIENYPESKEIMINNPKLQERFR